jgi:fibronectin-binding autotransporter adhesin
MSYSILCFMEIGKLFNTGEDNVVVISGLNDSLRRLMRDSGSQFKSNDRYRKGRLSYIGRGLISLLLLIFTATFAQATSYQWKNNAGGSWTGTANWTPTAPFGGPGAGDDVTIPSSVTSGISITGIPAVTINSLTINQNCTLAASVSNNVLTISGYLTVASGKTLTVGAGGQYLWITLSGTSTGSVIDGTVTIVRRNGTFPSYITNNGDLSITSTGLINGTGSFTLGAGATLRIGSADGINVLGTNTGNIQCGGGRTYTAGANYVYNGSSAQVTGSGLTQNTPANLTINNSAGVTLSAATSISGLLTMTSGTLTMSNFNLTLGSLTGTSDIACGSGTLRVGYDNTSPSPYSGVLSGSGAIVKYGTGTLVLSGANTTNGSITVSVGTLKLGNSSALGTITGNTVVVSGAVLDLNGITLSTAEPLSLNGTGLSSSPAGALTNTGGDASFSGPITLGSASNITATTSGSLTVSGNITGSVALTLDGDGTGIYSGIRSGTGSIVKSGTGVWTLSGSNAYTGSTTVSSGTLAMGAANCISNNSSIILDGGTLSTGTSSGYNTSLGTLTLQSSSTIALGTGSHNLNFIQSNGITWGTGATLTVTGWTGTVNVGGTAGKIFTGTNSSGLTAAQLAVVNFSGFENGAGISASTGEVFPSLPVITISSDNPAVAAGDVLQNTTDKVIYSFSAAVTKKDATMSGLQISTAGSYSASDITSLKAWYSTDNTFSSATDVLLSTIESPAAAGTQVFSSWTNQLFAVGTGYIFITADFPCSATVGKTIYVNAVTTSDITFLSGIKAGTTSAGGIQTVKYLNPENAPVVDASSADKQSVLTWTNPDGCYDEILIVAKANVAVTATPTGDGTAYTDNLAFGSGTALDGGYVVYKGTTSPKTVTALSNGITYYFTFFTRRGTTWSSGITCNATPTSDVAGDYRSATSGNWATGSTWQYYNGSSWVIPAAGPTSADNIVTIRNGHNVTVAANVTVDQVVVNSGGQVTVSTGRTLTIADGSDAVDFSVDGIVVNSGGTITSTGVLSFNNGSTYQHNMNGGNIPTASWDIASTCLVTGVTNTIPTIATFNQAFGNLTWNCTSQTTTESFAAQLTTVNGNLTVNSTGTGYLCLMLGGGSGSYPTVVYGNFIQTGGTFYLLGDDINPGAKTMEVKGNFTLSAGTFVVDGNSNGTSSGTLYLGGNLTLASGSTFTETGSGTATLYFNGTSTQTYTSAIGMSNKIDVIVSSGATLQMGTGASPSILSGTSGVFTLSSGATLGVTSAAGITTSGATGNIQVTGTRTYTAGASYIYNGTSAQVTGNGLTQNTPANLTINNSAGVKLSAATTISGLLTMSSGTLDMINTNLTVGSLTGSGNLTNATGTAGARTITVGSDGTSPAAYSGLISKGTATSVALTKVGAGTLTLSNSANSYNGVTTITAGELRLNPVSTTATFASQVVLNGGKLGTSGITAGTTITFASTLNLSSSSTIDLGANSHSLKFPNSSATAWAGTTFTVSNWGGTTGGRIYFGSDATGLIAGQINKFTFTGYPSGASITSAGEIVPPTSSITISSSSPAVAANSLVQGSTNNVVYSFSVNAPSTNASISGLTIPVSGSFAAGDIVTLKAWYSTDNSFSSSSDVLISTIAFPATTGTLTFPDWKNQSLSAGSTGYFFITADIACAAVATSYFNIDAVTASNISMYGTVTGTTYAGGSQSISILALTNVTSPAASAGDARSVLSWTAPANCYDEIMIVACVNTKTTGAPAYGTTYTASLTYGSGTAFTGGGYVVYSGSAYPQTQTVTSLSNGLTYYFTFFTRKGTVWSSGLTCKTTTIAAVANDFQSVATGNWGATATWLTYDGYRWATPTGGAAGLPTNNSNRVTIQYGTTVSIAADVTVDQVTIEAGGQVTINSGITLTINNGTGTDFTVSGTLLTNSTASTNGAGVAINAGATMAFNSGAIYQHNVNGGTIPTATWDAASTCYVTGVTTTVPGGWSQSFGNVTWNCTGQTGTNINLAGTLKTVNGDLTITTTNTGRLSLGTTQASSDLTLAGNFSMAAGTFYITGYNSSTASVNRAMNVGGNFSQTGGTIILSNTTTSTYGGTIGVAGNFTQTAGTITVNGSSTASGINFNGSGSAQLYSASGTISGPVNFNVSSPAYLQMGGTVSLPNVISNGSTGTFTLASGATLGITSAAGITSSGATGNIQVTGTRTYSTGANYVYDGGGTQSSGNGLPSTVNRLTLSGSSTNLNLTGSPLTITTGLTTNSGTNLNITATQAVTTNAFTNNGTIVINSSSLSQSGSLIATGTLSQTGTVTYNRQLRTEAGYGDYQYIASPVASNTATNSSYITEVYGWDEVGGTWPTTTMTALVSGRGYNLDQTTSSTGLITYTGLLTNSASIPATSPYSDVITGAEANYNSRTYVGSGGHSGVARSLTNYGGGGWNLLGNPFTSSMLVSSFITANSSAFDPNYVAVYLYDPTVGTKGAYYYIGNTTGWGAGLSQTHIQAGQGFYVMAMNDYATFTFSSAMQEHALTDAVMKSTKSEDRWPGLKIKAKQADIESYTTLVFNSDMTKGVDPGYDIGELSTYPEIDIYSILQEENGINYAQQALPSSDIDSLMIPLGVDCAAGGDVTFSAETEPLDGYSYLLEDRTSGTITDLSTATYTTTLPANTNGTGRFYLRLKEGSKTDVDPTPEDPDLLNVRLWANDNVVYVKGAVSEKAIATVYDLQGRLVYQNYLTEGTYNSFTVPNATGGIYIVRITDKSKILTKKVTLN